MGGPLRGAEGVKRGGMSEVYLGLSSPLNGGFFFSFEPFKVNCFVFFFFAGNFN